MTKLSVSELLKRPWRIEVLKNKILNNEEITLYNNKKVKVIDKNIIKYLNSDKPNELRKLGGSKPIKFITNIGSISLTQFGKTKEFGGGGGSGGGAKATSANESAQCLYGSLAFNVKKGKLKVSDITPENVKKAGKYIDIGKTSIKEIMKIDETWVESSIKIANILFDMYYSNKKMFFHRYSNFMNHIYDCKTKAFKNTYKTNVNNDKWNPSDIWISQVNYKNLKIPCDNVMDLNSFIKDLFISKDLIGVSLKKVVGNPKNKVYNMTKDEDSVKLKNIQLYKKSFFDSIDMYFITNKGKIQFRSFSEDSSFQSEIKGEHAAGGKASLGPINLILKSMNLSTLPEGKKITQMARNPNEKFYKDFYDLYLKYSENDSKNNNINDITDFINAINNTKKPNSFRFSKYMNLKLLDIIEKNKKRKDEFVTKLFQYASSSSDFSSVFVKIY